MLCLYCKYSHFVKNKYDGLCTLNGKVVSRISGCKNFKELEF